MGNTKKNYPIKASYSSRPRSSSFSSIGSWGLYEGAYNSSQTTLYGSRFPLPESAMLPSGDRLAIIAHLRQALRNDSRLAAIINRWALGIGVPTPHVSCYSAAVNDRVERYLERKFKRIRWGASKYASSLSALGMVALMERALCGEVFAVFMIDGTVRLISSELVGSPVSVKDELESDGVIYNADGTISAYRVGKRLPDTSISFEPEDCTIVPAQYMHQLGTPSRVEEVRISPPLSPAITVFQDIKELCGAKLGQAKAQAMIAFAVTKNIDPEIAAMTADSMNPQDFYDDITARSGYQKLSANTMYYLETGESIEAMQSQSNASDYDQFLLSNLDFACGCLGIPPEEAIAGYRRSNFSSSRAEKLRWKDVISRERTMWTAFYDALQYWLVNRGLFTGEIDLGGESARESIDWGYPELKEIDQSKATQSDIANYQSGLSTKSQILATRGLYADEVDAQQVADAVRLYELYKSAAERLGVDINSLIAMSGVRDTTAAFMKIPAESNQPVDAVG